jgi:hypothetical protein
LLDRLLNDFQHKHVLKVPSFDSIGVCIFKWNIQTPHLNDKIILKNYKLHLPNLYYIFTTKGI